MADEGSTEPPRFPPVDGPPSGPPAWPPDPGPPPFPPHPGYDWNRPSSPQSGGAPHWLHPLDIGRTFSAAWRLYRFNWRPMVLATGAVSVPLVLINAIYQGYLAGPAMTAWEDAYLAALQRRDFSAIPGPPPEYWISALLQLVTLLVGVLATAAVVYLVAAAYRGERLSALAGLRAAVRRGLALIGTLVLLFFAFIAVFIVGVLAVVLVAGVGYVIGGSGLALFLGLIAFVGTFAAFVFFAMRWSFFVQAVVIDRLSFAKALGRSWHLVAGSTWRVLGYLLLVYLTVLLVTIIAGVVLAFVALIANSVAGGPQSTGPTGFAMTLAQPIPLAIVGVGTAIIGAFVAPWWLAVMTLLYYDLRWRRGELRPEPAP